MIFIPAVILLQIAEVRKVSVQKQKILLEIKHENAFVFSFSHYFWTHFIADAIAHLNSG